VIELLWLGRNFSEAYELKAIDLGHIVERKVAI
jgi:hypothetical protein